MQPYVICQGNYLLSLAHQFGFDADTVWNDAKNAQLRQLRPNPNILYPSDVLYIPDQNVPPAMQSLVPGTTNTFVSSPPMVTVTQQFVGNDATAYASKAYTVQELDSLSGLTTDGNGIATFQAPVTLDTATITFTDTGETWALHLGHIDPIDTLSGIFQRLQHLHYIAGSAVFDSSNLRLLRGGLAAFKASQASASAASGGSAPASGPPPAPNSTPESAGSSPPDSVPTSSASDANGYDSGLGDDGTLDAATAALLLKVHGC